MSALVTDDGGKVRGDADFVFYNQPTAPGARLHGDTLTVDPAARRPGATRVTVVISAADPGTALGVLPAPTLHVTGPGGHVLTRFTPLRPRRETVLLLAELYRRGTAWKLRALGQGYADGLAGLARDFGVDVADDASSASAATPAPVALPLSRRGVAVRSPGAPSGTSGSPDPAAAGFLTLVNSARVAAGSPTVSLAGRAALRRRAGAHRRHGLGRPPRAPRAGTAPPSTSASPAPDTRI